VFDSSVWQMVGKGILETLYMTLFSSLLAYIVGIPLGIILVVTDKQGIRPFITLNKILGVIVNLIRSVPFIILLIAVTPITRALLGTSLGPTATVVSLFFASAPYIARLVESSMKEVDYGVIEAAKSMGASTMQIITRVMIPEAMPALLVGSAIAVTTILGYSAMAGVIGGGGLGDIAIRYGYHRNETDVTLITVVVLVLIVQVFQEIGMKMSRLSDKRN